MTKLSETFRETAPEFGNTRHQVVIDEPHQRIHDGTFFSSGVNDPILADTASLEVMIRVVGGAHMVVRLEHEGDATFEGFENVLTSADGVAVAAVNRNRFSANTADSSVFSGPTITGDGTKLAEQLLLGGSGGKAQSAEGSFFLEWLLSPGDYLIRLTNNSGTASRAQVLLDWYQRPG